MTGAPRPRAYLLLAAIAAVSYLALHVPMVIAGKVIADEGYYLYSARLLREGQIPYRDFLFWQPPAVLYIYAAAAEVIGWTLLPMRIFSTALGAIAAWMAWDVVRRRGGMNALIVLVPLLCLTPNYAFDTSIVKTQTLSIFLSMLALWTFERGAALPPGKARLARFVIAPIVMALAAGSRVSFLPFVLAFVAYVHDETGSKRDTLQVAAVSFGLLIAGFIAYYLLSEGTVLFGLLGYHRIIRNSSSAFSAWYLKGAIGNQPGLYAAIAALIGAVVLTRQQGGRMPPNPAANLQRFLATSWILITVIHVTAPYKYPTHQTSNMPLLAIALALALGARAGCAHPGWRPILLGVTWVFSPLGLFLGEYPLETRAPLPIAELREVADAIRPHVGPGETIYTSETVLAVEGGFTLTPGMNLGFYSLLGGFGFPHDQCVRRGAIDNAILAERWRAGEPAVVVIQAWDARMMQRDSSGPTFEDLYAILGERYEKVKTFQEVGQFDQETEIWARRGR